MKNLESVQDELDAAVVQYQGISDRSSSSLDLSSPLSLISCLQLEELELEDELEELELEDLEGPLFLYLMKP